MEIPATEKRHQQRHGVGGPLRLPSSLSQARGRVPRQLREVGDAPEARRHGDAGVHGARYHGQRDRQLQSHELRLLAVGRPDGSRLQVGDRRV